MSSREADCRSPYRLAPRDGDLAPLTDLWVAAWQAIMPAIDFAARRDWFLAYLIGIEQDGGVTLCAYDPQACLSGFILLDGPRKILEQIVVAPALFGGGLGEILLDHAKTLCPAGLDLTVNKDNPRAIRFYEKHGFMRIGEGVNPRSGLPILTMRWPGG